MADLVNYLQNAPATLLLDSFVMPTSTELIPSDLELNWAPVVDSKLIKMKTTYI